MRPPLHQRFVDKSVAAITAAVEVYNKPAFLYREETFSILALNAWELLLKAKVLKDANNAIASLRVYETRLTKAGVKSQKKFLKRNRAGNPLSITLGGCIARLDETPVSKLPKEIKANLDALIEIRDNSVHFITASATLARQAQELAAACVRNFILLAKNWFKRDFGAILNLVLPLSFVTASQDAGAVVVSADESRLIAHLKTLAQEVGDGEGEYAVAIRLQVKLEKSALANASKIQVSKDADAIKVQLAEQDIKERYPWTYDELCKRMTARYSDFKMNNKFHALRKPLLDDEKYAKVRYLDLENKAGPKKPYFNANILQVFDQHYTKKVG
ncbi:hypothetical protein BGV57_23305 [Burkholderia ubonensis]|uniref:DUF3644 domain-containing protein n=1 Tax=Burkholderia ubonensis TaxID=101571 RepID=UPI0008FE192B|nr:DUF3644 domain-containing protein [Burkholderia ubonensis]OJB37518.1 hypothetical protein BGV57_23305 [Burkholderia ubonensis]